MLYLTLDIGNTSCSIAAFRNRMLHKPLTFFRHDLKSLRRFLDKWDEPMICIVSAVAGADKIMALLKKKARVIRISNSLALPVRNLYGTPETLGNDRLASAAGAAGMFPGRNLLVIDAGTCIKYDVVTKEGKYLGGSIAPGLEMRLKAVHVFTDRLPLVKAAAMPKLPGKNTNDSILTGVLHGIRFEIEGFISHYKKQYSNLKVVMTGGDSERLAKALKSNIFAAPYLVHHGLYEILKKNTA